MPLCRKGNDRMSETKKDTAQTRHGIDFRKVLKRLLIFLLIYTLSSMLFSAVIFRVLYARRDGIPVFGRTFEELGAEAPTRERFTFSSDGNELTAYRYPATDAKGVILIVNGIGAGADAHLAEILYFLDHGWSVVTWDATGVGSSEGRGLLGLQQIRLDLDAYLASPEAQAETLPVVIYGHSAGAYAAANSLAGDYPVRAAVCVCGFESPVDVMFYHARQKVGPLAVIQYPFLLLECYFLFGGDANDSAAEAIEHSQTPVLLIESSSDDYVPQELAISGHLTDGPGLNVTRLVIDSDWRNEHNTPWLSSSSAEYVGTADPSAPVNKDQASELDETYMEQILTFYEAAVAP